MADEIKRITLTSDWQLLGESGRDFEVYNAEAIFDFTKTSDDTAPTANADFATIGGGLSIIGFNLSSQSRSIYVRKTSIPHASAIASTLAWDYIDG